MIDRTLYCGNHTTMQTDLLNEVEEYTIANHPKAHMVSGAYQGRLLSMVSHLLKPTYILEVGTFTGFSALCLAEGLLVDGELHTIENRMEDAKIAQHFFNKSEYKNSIILHEGDAKDIIPTLPFDWDVVFLDADKISYINYYEMVIDKLKIGGIIIADNVLFHNQVLEENIVGKNAIAINEFNKYVLKSNRIETIMLPVRDGISILRKVK